MRTVAESGKFVRIVLIATLLAASPWASNAQEVPAPKIIPPATAEMQSADFWVSRLDGDPDEVILTPARISALNGKNGTRPFETTDINGDPYSIADIVARKDVIGVVFRVENPLTIAAFPGDSLRARLERARNYLESGSFWDRRQMKYDDEMKAELIEKTNPGAIPDTVAPKYGVLVKHTLSRVFPTELPGWNRQGGRGDSFQAASLDMATPVAVLHASPDRDWLYIRSEITFGWVPAENVAVGPPDQIERALAREPFLVSTAHKVPVFADRSFTTHLVDFYLGARLPLLRKTAHWYQVMTPFRDADGSLTFAPGYIRADAGVSEGYQPFTRRNVLETAFRLLYRPYAWADAFNERDCCGTIRSVYRTFGFKMPRWTTHELHFADRCHAFPRDTPSEVKYGILDSCQPGVTLVGHGGHISMYIGKAGGGYFVIHQSGYGYRGGDGTRYVVQRVNVNDTELPGGSNVGTWTEISEFRP